MQKLTRFQLILIIAFFTYLANTPYVMAQNYNLIVKLKKQVEQSTQDKEKIDLLNQISTAYYDINDTMLMYARKALNLAEKTNFIEGRIDAYVNHGFYYSGYLRNMERANEYFDTALVLCKQHNKQLVAETAFKIAQKLNPDRQAKHAKNYLVTAINNCNKDNFENYQKCLYLLTDIYGRLRIQDSTLYYLRLYGRTTKVDDNMQMAEFYILSAIVYGDYFDSAEEQTNYYQKAEIELNTFKTINQDNEELHRLFILLYYSIGNSQWKKGQWEAARLYYVKLIDYFENNRLYISQPFCFHHELWTAYAFSIRNLINEKKQKQSREMIEKGLNFFAKQNDNYHYAKMLWSIESSYWRFSDYFNAFRYQQKEFKAWKKIENKYWMCINLENTGMIHGRLGNYEKQLSIYYQLLDVAQSSQITAFTLYAYKDLAKSYYHLNKSDSGLFYIKKAIELNKEVDNSFISMVNYYTKGLLNEQKKNYDEAIAAYIQARDIMNRYNYPMNTYDRVAAQSALARTYLKTGEYTKAYDNAFRSLSQAKSENVKEVMRNDYHTLAELCKIDGNKDLAIEFYESFIKLKDELAGEEAKKAMQRAEIENIKKQNEQEKLLLQKENQLKEMQLKLQKQLTFMAIIGFILLSLLSLVVYRSYRQKKKDNILLEKQKSEIEHKNNILQQLNEDLFLKNEEIKTQNEEIARQHNTLEKQTRDITDSINYAWRIQEAIMPSKKMVAKNIPDFFVLYKPRDIVSGDFYWFKEIKNLLYVVAADCTGHGVPGAFMSMLGISTLNEIVTRRDVNPPNVILNQLRKKVKKSLHQTGKHGETQDGMDMSLLLFDFENNTLQFSGAYNPLYLYRQTSTDNSNYEHETIKANRMPIGIHPKDDNEFTNHELQLNKGDIMYIFSDGYVSQFGGDKGDKLKSRRFKDLIAAHIDKPMHEQKIIFDKYLTQWQGNYKQVDDILVIGLRV